MLPNKQMRLTPQRKVILEALQETDSHPTADEIYETVRRVMPRISLGTVYRNLDLMASEGLILKLHVEDSQMRFDGNTDPHLHIACIHCGKVSDIFETPDLNEFITSLPTDYAILNYTLLLHGVCPSCQKNSPRDGHSA